MYQIRKEILKSLHVQTASSSARSFKTKKTKLGAFRESVFIQTAQNHKSCQEFFMSEHFETSSVLRPSVQIKKQTLCAGGQESSKQ